MCRDITEICKEAFAGIISYCQDRLPCWHTDEHAGIAVPIRVVIKIMVPSWV